MMKTIFILHLWEMSKRHNVDKVLFVQNIAGRETMEVVMKAEGLSNTSADDVQKIFYAGVNITDIFNKNLYHGEAETSKTNSMATYCAKDVRFPKKGKRIIITVDSSYEVEDEKNTVVIRLILIRRKLLDKVCGRIYQKNYILQYTQR